MVCAAARRRGQGLRRAGGDGGLAYLGHGVLEELAVLALEDGVDVGADEPDAVLAQEAAFVAAPWRGSGPSARRGRRGGCRAFPFRLCAPPCAGRAARCRPWSAMSGSVMIVAGLEFTSTVSTPSSMSSAAGLGAGVVELRGLAYDDGPGAYDEDLFNAVILRHRSRPPIMEMNLLEHAAAVERPAVGLGVELQREGAACRGSRAPRRSRR